MFESFLKEKIYYDKVQEYRKPIKGTEFNLLDEVIINKVSYYYENDYIGQIGIIIGKQRDEYEILCKDGKVISREEIERYYGELHEDFKLMNTIEKEKKEIEKMQKELQDKANNFIELSNKLNKDNIDKLITLKQTN